MIVNWDNIQNGDEMELDSVTLQFFAGGTGDIIIEGKSTLNSEYVEAKSRIVAPDIITESFGRCFIRFTVPETATLQASRLKT